MQLVVSCQCSSQIPEQATLQVFDTCHHNCQMHMEMTCHAVKLIAGSSPKQV